MSKALSTWVFGMAMSGLFTLIIVLVDPIRNDPTYLRNAAYFGTAMLIAFFIWTAIAAIEYKNQRKV